MYAAGVETSRLGPEISARATVLPHFRGHHFYCQVWVPPSLIKWATQKSLMGFSSTPATYQLYELDKSLHLLEHIPRFFTLFCVLWIPLIIRWMSWIVSHNEVLLHNEMEDFEESIINFFWYSKNVLLYFHAKYQHQETDLKYHNFEVVDECK